MAKRRLGRWWPHAGRGGGQAQSPRPLGSVKEPGRTPSSHSAAATKTTTTLTTTTGTAITTRLEKATTTWTAAMRRETTTAPRRGKRATRTERRTDKFLLPRDYIVK